MNKSLFLLLFAAVFIFQYCAPATTEASGFSEFEAALEKDPSPENINNLLNAYNTFISENKSDRESVAAVYEKAYQATLKHRPAATPVYLMGLLREGTVEDPNNPDYIYQLGQALESQGKIEAANVMYGNLVDLFPDHAKSAELAGTLAGVKPVDIIGQLAIERLENPDQYGINKEASFKYVDACEAYALSNPRGPNAAEYLFDAAEMAKLLRTNHKALNIYDWLVSKYPNYEKTPSALFIKAFILENEMNNIDEARLAYQLFLEKYPDNDFADDARFSLENLGKSPDEVLKAIEANANK